MTDVQPEIRFTASTVEARPPKIAGYASVFDKHSRDLGGFIERVAPTAFNMSRGVGWPDVVARWNHENSGLLGSIAGKTLTLTVDRTGLWYEVEPPAARADVLELVQRGDVSKSSFAFWTAKDADEWDLGPGDLPRRTLVSVRLVDVAPVIMPAYVDTSAAVRSLAEHKDVSAKEVRSLAAQGALRKLFTRSDVPSRTPAQVRAFLDSRRRDPWAGGR